MGRINCEEAPQVHLPMLCRLIFGQHPLKIQKDTCSIVKSHTWISGGPGCPRKQRIEASTSPPGFVFVRPILPQLPHCARPCIWFKQ